MSEDGAEAVFPADTWRSASKEDLPECAEHSKLTEDGACGLDDC